MWPLGDGVFPPVALKVFETEFGAAGVENPRRDIKNLNWLGDES
jgi:hypothetical protein